MSKHLKVVWCYPYTRLQFLLVLAYGQLYGLIVTVAFVLSMFGCTKEGTVFLIVITVCTDGFFM